MMKHSTLFSFLFVTFFLACRTPGFSNIQEGDLIFQISKSSQSQAIQIATGSKYSHMGIIFKEDGRLYVLEAVGPVKKTPLKEWINRGEKKHFVIKRLKNSQLLSTHVIELMKENSNHYIGKPYDVYFEWSDSRIYCSELVWKLYKESMGIEIGKLQHMKDFNLNNPLVKKKLTERYVNQIPLEEKVISPAAMFESNNLETITN